MCVVQCRYLRLVRDVIYFLESARGLQSLERPLSDDRAGTVIPESDAAMDQPMGSGSAAGPAARLDAERTSSDVSAQFAATRSTISDRKDEDSSTPSELPGNMSTHTAGRPTDDMDLDTPPSDSTEDAMAHNVSASKSHSPVAPFRTSPTPTPPREDVQLEWGAARPRELLGASEQQLMDRSAEDSTRLNEDSGRSTAAITVSAANSPSTPLVHKRSHPTTHSSPRRPSQDGPSTADRNVVRRAPGSEDVASAAHVHSDLQKSSGVHEAARFHDIQCCKSTQICCTSTALSLSSLM